MTTQVIIEPKQVLFLWREDGIQCRVKFRTLCEYQTVTIKWHCSTRGWWLSFPILLPSTVKALCFYVERHFRSCWRYVSCLIISLRWFSLSLLSGPCGLVFAVVHLAPAPAGGSFIPVLPTMKWTLASRASIKGALTTAELSAQVQSNVLTYVASK